MDRIKGAILAAGRGTRLRPLTEVTNKILLPVFDQPMIIGPINTLKALGVEDICIVTSKEHLSSFMKFLGDGSTFDVRFTYVVQDRPLGIAHALLQAEDFFKGSKVIATLGDNIFENVSVDKSALSDGFAYVFIKDVEHPQRFGVAEMDANGHVTRITEKPKQPKTRHAVTGLYIYPGDVFSFIRGMEPSGRGELEITDVNNHYIKSGRLRACKVPGYWLDTGTFESLLKASILRALESDRSMFDGIDRKALKDALGRV